MKANLGTIDRYVRGMFSAFIIGLYFFHVLNTAVAIILLVIASLLAISSLCKVCPVYFGFGISTKKKE